MSFLSEGNGSANKMYGVCILLKEQCARSREQIQISLQCASVGIVIPAYLFIILPHYSSTGVM